MPALVQALHTEGLCGADHMHGYHCRCEYCDFDSHWAFRAQTDSSCGGEVISGVMTDHAEAREHMDALQRLAVEVDAEPSLRAGVHVHVGIQSLHHSRERLADALWAYLRWENVLGAIVAPGRWPEIRENNTPARTAMGQVALLDHYAHIGITNDDDEFLPWHQDNRGRRRRYNAYGPMDPIWVERRFDDPTLLRHVKEAYLDSMYDIDRHGWLNLSTRSNRTWEFRLYNATRVAWRMEMYARTSLLFVNPDVHDDLLQRTTNPTQTNLLTIAGRHDPALKRLLRRQIDAPKGHDPFSALSATLQSPPPDDVMLDWSTPGVPMGSRPARVVPSSAFDPAYRVDAVRRARETINGLWTDIQPSASNAPRWVVEPEPPVYDEPDWESAFDDDYPDDRDVCNDPSCCPQPVGAVR